ncbi:hypothetical protein JVU11DRAFT_7070 [Chiua virens]|nr:hypothetical protein JVU11DRAFT_7070 [Chiua virens]
MLVILWIGVRSKSLSGYSGLELALGCQRILFEHNILDVDVEIRESEVCLDSNSGPELLAPTPPLPSDSNHLIKVLEPLTTTLGLPISTELIPSVQGTAGLFIQTEGGNGKKLLLITARHVLFAPDKNNNHYRHKNTSQPRHNVVLFGNSGFKQYQELISREIRDKKMVSQRIRDSNWRR